jgi:hypothetical protein
MKSFSVLLSLGIRLDDRRRTAPATRLGIVSGFLTPQMGDCSHPEKSHFSRFFAGSRAAKPHVS